MTVAAVNTTEAMAGLVQPQPLTGCIDGILCGLLTGWVYDPDNNSPDISLVVDGNILETTKPHMLRLDVQECLGLSGLYGFSFDLGELPLEYVSEIRVEYAEKGFDFGGEVLPYCPLVEDFRLDLQNIFFSEFYRSAHNLHGLKDEEVFMHYLKFGIYEDYDPNPWFSTDYYRVHYSGYLDDIELPILSYLTLESGMGVQASSEFDPRFYAENNLLSDVSEGYLAHYVKRGHKQGQLPVNRVLPDVIRQETKELIAIEPDLATFEPEDLHVVRYPVLRPTTYLPSQLRHQFGDSISVIVCVPYISCGGADLISTFVLRAYQQHYGAERVLLVVTDRTLNEMPQWINKDSNIVFLAHDKDVRGVAEKVHVLHTIVGRLAPDRVFNINSHVAWEMYEKYGSQLSAEVQLGAYLFCHDYDKKGQQVGYIRDYIPRTIKYLDRVFCDNKKIVEDINSTYGFTDEQRQIFQHLYVPIIEDGALDNAYDGAVNAGRKILWSGRLARQKRPELLIEIANAMPNYTFDVYGPEGDSDSAMRIVSGDYKNIVYRGIYQNLREIEFNEYSVFLNTSAWDGLPTVLIQMMGIGVPIVTSDVGGISELVTDKTGYLVVNDEATSYVSELKKILFRAELADMKAQLGKREVAKVHNWRSFYSSFEKNGGFSHKSEEGDKSGYFVKRKTVKS